MLAIQHWKVYPVHYGAENSILSMSLMKKVMWQKEHENYGIPITESTLEQCHRMFKLLSITKTNARFPILYNETSDYEYRQARFVLKTKNTVTLEELKHEFSLCSKNSSIE